MPLFRFTPSEIDTWNISRRALNGPFGPPSELVLHLQAPVRFSYLPLASAAGRRVRGTVLT